VHSVVVIDMLNFINFNTFFNVCDVFILGKAFSGDKTMAAFQVMIINITHIEI